MDSLNPTTMQEKYQEAAELCANYYQDEKILAARAIFQALGDYQDCPRRVEWCDRYLSFALGKQVEFGSYKGQPLRWKVLLTNGRKRLLLAEDVVDMVPFSLARDHADWSISHLRRWLNKDFVQSAFTLPEQMMILLSRNENNTDPRWSVENGPETRDKLFVFTLQELDTYLPEQADRAVGQWWWLRGHGVECRTIMSVCDDGSIYHLGVSKDSTSMGVRPSMWLRLK